MSRYGVEATHAERYRVVVGWDNPLCTFFVQVWDLAKETEQEEDCVFWVGTHPGSVPSVAALSRAISAYAVLPADTAAQLQWDQATSASPTTFQLWIRSHFIRPVNASSPAGVQYEKGGERGGR